MIFAEVAQGKAVQMPLMGRIAERAEIRVVRSYDEHATAGLEQPVEFLDRADNIRYVFDEMDCADFVKGTVAEREREVVKIGDYVSIGVRIPIDSDCTWIFLDPAAYIEYPPVGTARP